MTEYSQVSLRLVFLLVAYIDPGTGSLILQILLGGVAGLWMILKLFGHRIKAFFGISQKGREEEKN